MVSLFNLKMEMERYLHPNR